MLKAKHRALQMFFAFGRTAQSGDLGMETTSSPCYSGIKRNLNVWLLAKGLLLMASNVLRFLLRDILVTFFMVSLGYWLRSRFKAEVVQIKMGL